MRYFFVIQANYYKIFCLFLYLLSSSKVLARGYESYLEGAGEGGGGGSSDFSIFLFTVILIIIFSYNFYRSSEFRKSVFHVVFFIGFVCILPLTMFMGDVKDKESAMVAVVVMFIIHKFIYFVIDKSKEKSKQTDFTSLKTATDEVPSHSIKSKSFEGHNRISDDFKFKINPIKLEEVKKSDVAKKINVSLDDSENSNNAKKNKEASGLIDGSNYKNYLSESFPSSKPFFSEPTKTNSDAAYDINRTIKDIQSSKPKEIIETDFVNIRKNKAKALFGVRIQSELRSLSLKDKMLWHECRLETKGDENSAILLYRVAREKFLFKGNLDLINDRHGLDIVDSNMNYGFCVSMNDAKKLAFSS